MIKNVETLMREYVEELNDKTSLMLFEKLPAGKRLRAKLIFEIAKDSKDAIKLASIVEMIHAASLLHDDVIDESDTRRGVASINAIYGNKNAIMFGDILYSKAFFELVDMSKDVAKSISNAVTLLSIGELLDVELGKYMNLNEDIYFDMIYKKTASLIEAAATSAAILAGKDKNAYGIYGRNLGLSFQIIDDILDITQDEKILGKPALNDFKEGKTTLPYIYLYNDLPKDDKIKLQKMFKQELDDEQKSWIKMQMEKYNSIQNAFIKAKELAKDALSKIDIKDEGLIKVMTQMIDREF